VGRLGVDNGADDPDAAYAFTKLREYAFEDTAAVRAGSGSGVASAGRVLTALCLWFFFFPRARSGPQPDYLVLSARTLHGRPVAGYNPLRARFRLAKRQVSRVQGVTERLVLHASPWSASDLAEQRHKRAVLDPVEVVEEDAAEAAADDLPAMGGGTPTFGAAGGVWGRPRGSVSP
jgi:hypothetical protein